MPWVVLRNRSAIIPITAVAKKGFCWTRNSKRLRSTGTTRQGVLATASVLPLAAATGLERLKADVDFLADAELGGRMTGSDGEAAAAAYIEKQLQAMGAAPVNGNGYANAFGFTAGVHDDGSSVRVIAGEETAVFRGTDKLHSLSFSDDGTVRGEVVFAGYGLRVPESRDFPKDRSASPTC